MILVETSYSRSLTAYCRLKAVPVLPSHDSIQSLAESFGQFFEAEITKLWQDLTSAPSSVATDSGVTMCPTSLQSFHCFFFFCQENLSSTKSCSLDPIPTSILKVSIDILPHITTIMNTSLMQEILIKLQELPRMSIHIEDNPQPRRLWVITPSLTCPLFVRC